RYVDSIIRHAKLVVVRLLGGRGYWPYGVDEIAACCRAHDIPLALLPGDDQPDAELARLTTLPGPTAHRLWQYLVHGGVANADQFLRYCATLMGRDTAWQEPAPLLRGGFYWPGGDARALSDVTRHWQDGQPVAAITFYRALVQAGNLAPVDDLIEALSAAGLNPLPVYVASLKDSVAAATLVAAFEQVPPDIILNATAFAIAKPGQAMTDTPFGQTDAPVLQVVFSGGSARAWRESTTGLSSRDVAMNVALPEVDGRILARAVSFKGSAQRDALTQTDLVRYEPVADRIGFTAQLAANWCALRRRDVGKRRLALVLANYPNKDGRIGNGVGLDTPASTLLVLRALAEAGYRVNDLPADGDALIAALQAGPTNCGVGGRIVTETLGLSDYESFFSGLPRGIQEQVRERWGAPEGDPFFMPGRTDCGGFAIAALRLGNVVVGLQPARGYNIDPVRSYHDSALVPPHGYFAFYAWVRQAFKADAIVHMGKHGNLEWLPGKALALSADCFPEAVLGALPHLYPFIVNDPGEGTQAKRRAQGVIIDHLTPPLTRAESYGPLRQLELLVDEYYEAASLDPRRVPVLRQQILELSQSIGLDRDLGITADNDDDALGALDNYLCELKEMQIRDGLHVFGQSPTGRLRTDLLVALTRLPRGRDMGAQDGGGDASLIRALAADLGMTFDPLDCVLGAPWTGPKPTALAHMDGLWRTNGDTVERLELLAGQLVAGDKEMDSTWTRVRAVLDTLSRQIAPAVDSCGQAEIAGLLTGLDGRFVAPGPSGAPTRGKPDVLPTGRNFYSVDTRTVPTQAAWQLGWRSATLLVERYAQEHGEWPKSLAISAWGTSNMRTGGDDIAQALALLGVQPEWDPMSRRVTGFSVMPVGVLGRPRVDVTLRISGFFRDAFANLIDLFDSAVAAVAALDESAEDNPLAAQVREETARLVAGGTDKAVAERHASWRIFGAKPGAYGAGLQALIDERGWEKEDDLAKAYMAWGGYAYGAGAGSGNGKGDGIAAHDQFARRLGRIDGVVQNQDNREHDLLDSDDYYQFEGGLTAAVRLASGRQPAVYHNDHSRPFAPVIRSLAEEVSRVVRARVVNPKWIAGVMRHGYKGAFEMAATVDYLFAFAATAHCVRDDQFDMVYAAYLEDPDVHDFLAAHNPDALQEMAARFLEAQQRGLWRPRSNSAYARLQAIAAGESRS
ncbi:MAG: cobaltochelatase subunit CobN, partial [Alphaproteobacteria bacterium]